MSKKSIDYEFDTKADSLRMAGLSDIEVAEELSKEYYDKKQIIRVLDKIIHPNKRGELLKHKKTLSLLGSIAIIFGLFEIIYTLSSESFEWSFEAFSFELFNDTIFGIFLLTSWGTLSRTHSMEHKWNTFISVLMVLTNSLEVFREEGQLMWLGMIQAITWLAVLAFNIKWSIRKKK